MAYTADDLLVEVRDLGSLPSTTATGTSDAALLRHADGELRDTLVPLMLGCREELYERVFDTAITVGTAAYRINKRAAISRLNTVQWVNPDNSFRNLTRLEPKQIAELGLLATTSGQPVSYYLEGANVVLYPTPAAAGTLRVRAFVRPGRLNLLATCKIISAVSATQYLVANDSWLLTMTAHGFSTSAPPDVIAATPSFEYLCLEPTTGFIVQDVDTVQMLKTSFSTIPAVGDYGCPRDTSPFVQLPVELHPALVELTVTRVLRSLGKLSEADKHGKEAERLVKLGISGLTPRVETADRKIVGGPMWRKRSYLRGGI